MSSTGLDVFDTTLHKTNAWLADLMAELHTDDRKYAYRVLRATLHALRDRLPVGETSDFGAQLPMLVRGIFYEGWRPSDTPTDDDREAFLSRVAEAMSDQPGPPDPERWIQATFRVIAARVDAGEVADVAGILPQDLRQLWPEAVRT